LQHVSMLIIR